MTSRFFYFLICVRKTYIPYQVLMLSVPFSPQLPGHCSLLFSKFNHIKYYLVTSSSSWWKCYWLPSQLSIRIYWKTHVIKRKLEFLVIAIPFLSLRQENRGNVNNGTYCTAVKPHRI